MRLSGLGDPVAGWEGAISGLAYYWSECAKVRITTIGLCRRDLDCCCTRLGWYRGKGSPFTGIHPVGILGGNRDSEALAVFDGNTSTPRRSLEGR